MVVEDNADARRLVLHALKRHDIGVMEAGDGATALELINGPASPDVVLVDLSMPNMDGAEFIRQLKANPKGAGIKVAIVSGWDDLAARAKDLRADGYVRKPIDIHVLQREVTRLLQLH